MIAGLLLICNSLTLVFIDSRAIHSFIFVSHVKSLNHKIEHSEGGMFISTPSGKVFMVELVCKDYEL